MWLNDNPIRLSSQSVPTIHDSKMQSERQHKGRGRGVSEVHDMFVKISLSLSLSLSFPLIDVVHNALVQQQNEQ